MAFFWEVYDTLTGAGRGEIGVTIGVGRGE